MEKLETLYTTDEWFPKRPLRGKVRETYPLEGNRLLIVATDRISAFDVVALKAVPSKGRVLTEMSFFWFALTQEVVENHFLTRDLSSLPAEFRPRLELLKGRSMIVKRAEVVPIECVVRGYLAGSGLKEYQQSGTVCGIQLPGGLKEGDRLPQPILTPATKAMVGLHDENISPERAKEIVGEDEYLFMEDRSLAVYEMAADYARTRGIIIADTKLEFGWYDGRLILVDEVLTPDSSRFWPVDDWLPGRAQRSFDKQPLRDYLESTGWDKQPPMPPLPDEVVAATSSRYQTAQRMLTGT
ncbi:MAG: phosphoribosylaminoimidazolesuccinocarboxamide synthase [Patescibacteria group bacterium]